MVVLPFKYDILRIHGPTEQNSFGGTTHSEEGVSMFTFFYVVIFYGVSLFVLCQQMVILFGLLESHGINVPDPYPWFRSFTKKLQRKAA